MMALRLVTVVLGAVLAAACGSAAMHEQATPTAVVTVTRVNPTTAAPSSIPTATSIAIPVAARTPPPSTGAANLDTIITAILTHDGAKIAPWIQGADVPCDGSQFLPCLAGSPLGTRVRAFSSSGCDGVEFLVTPTTGVEVSPYIVDRADRLIAVLRAPAHDLFADYEVYFASKTDLANRVGVRGDSVSAYSTGCRATASDIGAKVRGDPRLILGPFP